MDLPSQCFSCLAIESSSHDNGYLANAIHWFQNHMDQVGNFWMWHYSLQQAAWNVTRCPGRIPSTWGHGNAGYISTGCGIAGGCSPDGFISLGNVATWGGIYEQMAGRLSAYFVVGCDVAKGDTGSDFLFEIAKRLKCPVSAQTELIWSNGERIWSDDTSVWKTATPTVRPSAEPELKVVDKQSQGELRLMTGEGYRPVSFERIIRVVLRRGFGNLSEASVEFLRRDKDGFLDALAMSEPFESGGVPAAVVTGILEMTLVLDNVEQARQFVIYNERLVQDAAYNRVYYRISPDYARFMNV